MVAHCPRCQTNVTVDQNGRCAYCRRIVPIDGLAPAPPPAPSARRAQAATTVCKTCGRGQRAHTAGPYAGLCETCAAEKGRAMQATREATLARKHRNGKDPAVLPPAPAAANGTQPAESVEARLSPLLGAARRIDAARAVLAGLDETRRAAEADLEAARGDLEAAVTGIDAAALTR